MIPSDKAFVKATLSAHMESPKELLSILHPKVISPLLERSATPTGKFEYFAWEKVDAFCAFLISFVILCFKTEIQVKMVDHHLLLHLESAVLLHFHYLH